MCRDRFNGTPLEDAVRHHFEVTNAAQVQKLLRSHGASLSGEGLRYSSMLQCAEVCCSVLQCVAVCRSAVYVQKLLRSHSA